MADKNFRVKNGLEVGGTEIDIAQGTTIEYSENNDRANRPVIKSTTGNTSGLRVEAPNATTSAVSVISAFSTNDGDNGKFVGIQARGGTNPLRIQSGEYTAGVLSPAGDAVAFIDGGTLYATVNPAGVINNTDLATKLYVDTNESDTTYTIDASSTTGGANFNLTGSDSSLDVVKFANGTNVTVTATDANTITVDSVNTTYTQDASSTTGGANLNLVGSDATTDTIKFSGAGSTTVSQVNANEIQISSVDTNTTYTQNASVESGGAGLNLVGSDSTTDTVKFAGGTNVTVVATDANTITINAPDTNTTYTIAAASTTGGANFNLVGSDATTDTIKLANGTGVTVTQTSASEIGIAIGQDVATSASPTFVGGTFTGNITTAGGAANRFTRTATGTGNNAALILNRNRTDAARAAAGGPWLAFEYQGTDNTQATSTINAIRAQYDTTGRNYLELLEMSGSFTTGIQTIARFKRGDYFLKNTTGINSFTLDDDNCSITSQVATAGFQNVLFLNKRRTDVTAPTDGDLADFRIAFQGNTGLAISVGKFEGEYNATTGHKFSTNVYDSTGTTSIAAVESSQKETIIAGIPTAGGAPAAIATFNRDNIILGGTTGTLAGGNLLYRRTYGCFHKIANVTAAAANTVYNFDWYTDTTAHVGNEGVTVTSGNPTRVNIDTASDYEVVVEMQAKNTDNADRTAWIWLAKNGTDLSESRIKVQLRANGGSDAYQLITKMWVLENIAANDYIEVRFAVDNASGISLEYEAAQVSPFAMPAQPSATITVTPIGA